MLNNFLKERSSDQSGFLQGTINLVIKHFLHKLKEKIDRNTFKKVKLYCIFILICVKKKYPEPVKIGPATQHCSVGWSDF